MMEATSRNLSSKRCTKEIQNFVKFVFRLPESDRNESEFTNGSFFPPFRTEANTSCEDAAESATEPAATSVGPATASPSAQHHSVENHSGKLPLPTSQPLSSYTSSLLQRPPVVTQQHNGPPVTLRGDVPFRPTNTLRLTPVEKLNSTPSPLQPEPSALRPPPLSL